MENAIEVKALVVDRGKQTGLNGLTCSVPRGSVTGLLGPSGSGKTTLMRCIVGVQRMRAGRVASSLTASSLTSMSSSCAARAAASVISLLRAR